MQNASLSLSFVFASFAFLGLAACSVNTTRDPDDVNRAGAVQTPTTSTGGAECSKGSCHQECPAGQTCSATCSGGGCQQICGANAECSFTCSGGGCNQSCGAGASCTFTCSGNGCVRQ